MSQVTIVHTNIFVNYFISFGYIAIIMNKEKLFNHTCT